MTKKFVRKIQNYTHDIKYYLFRKDQIVIIKKIKLLGESKYDVSGI